jgi:hypothetical protein
MRNCRTCTETGDNVFDGPADPLTQHCEETTYHSFLLSINPTRISTSLGESRVLPLNVGR